MRAGRIKALVSDSSVTGVFVHPRSLETAAALDFNRAAFLLVSFSSGRDGLSAERSQHGLSPLEDAPRPVASPPGRLAQAELGDQVLGGTGSDPEFRRDHARRDDRPRQHVVEESRQF